MEQAQIAYDQFRAAVATREFWESNPSRTATLTLHLNGHTLETMAMLVGTNPDGTPNIRVSQKADGNTIISVGTLPDLGAVLASASKTLGLTE